MERGAVIITFFLVGSLASVVGSICGIGGGVIIKPFLDLLHLVDVPRASFLSGGTVLAMSCYSVLKNLHSREGSINLSIGTPLAAGSLVGGVLGTYLFTAALRTLSDADAVGAIQSAAMLLLTVITIGYTLVKNRIRTHHVEGWAVPVAIGLVLGAISSFLGIGGGPLNLVAFSYFFSMLTKTAAQNSLYVIFLSQVANIVSYLATGSVPGGETLPLVLMVVGGLVGGCVGRKVSMHIDHGDAEKLFLFLQAAIVVVCILNLGRFVSA